MRRHHRLRRQQGAPRKPLGQVRSPTPDYLSAQTQMVHSLRLPRWVGSPNEMRNKAHQLTTRQKMLEKAGHPVFSNPRMSLKEEERQEGDRTPFRRFGEAV